jgi:predicted acylesterase/phospholipase RssA
MALVLQGGGALGAFELGALRALYSPEGYGEDGFAPGLIAGVSIGAITAVLLARPRAGLAPMEALEAFWKKVAVSAAFLPPPLRPYASAFGNPHFFLPRTDVFSIPSWTSFYDVAPLRRTLSELVDEERLAENVAPRLLLEATDITRGEVRVFDSMKEPLSLDHVLASGSLPPSFPMTTIDKVPYWDGGVFDNTPLGAVLERMDPTPEREVEREIIVINLFPNAAEPPQNMAQVGQRFLNILFSNKTASDLRLLDRFNDIAALFDEIRRNHPDLAKSKVFTDADRGYIRVPKIVPITRIAAAEFNSAGDFSPEGIDARAAEGWRAAIKALENARRASKP